MSDPRRKLGTPTPTDPLTGLPKSDKETIVSFAERHGWETSHSAGGYYSEWRFTKGRNWIDLWLWSSSRGRAYGSVALATINGEEVRPAKRERVEQLLVRETPAIHAVRGIDLSKAEQEQREFTR